MDVQSLNLGFLNDQTIKRNLLMISFFLDNQIIYIVLILTHFPRGGSCFSATRFLKERPCFKVRKRVKKGKVKTMFKFPHDIIR